MEGAFAAQQLSEIRGAIITLKNGKNPGIDSISAEMLKCTQDGAIKKLHVFFKDYGRVESSIRLEKITRNENHQERESDHTCDNHHGISLLLVSSKIFCRILIDRIKMGVDERLRQELQTRKGNYGTDIHTWKQLKPCMERQAPIYVNFVDFM